MGQFDTDPVLTHSGQRNEQRFLETHVLPFRRTLRPHPISSHRLSCANLCQRYWSARGVGNRISESTASSQQVSREPYFIVTTCHLSLSRGPPGKSSPVGDGERNERAI